MKKVYYQVLEKMSESPIYYNFETKEYLEDKPLIYMTEEEKEE